MKALLSGRRYVVTQDVPNPLKDRRSKSFMNVEVWIAGTRVKVRPLPHEKDDPLLKGIIEGPDGTQVRFDASLESRGLERDRVMRQGNTLTDCLAPEPERLGYILDDASQDGAVVLAVLLERGVLTMDQVKEALKTLESLPDGGNAFRHSHAI